MSYDRGHVVSSLLVWIGGGITKLNIICKIANEVIYPPLDYNLISDRSTILFTIA